MNYDIFLRYEQRLDEGGYLVTTEDGVALSDAGARLRLELGHWLVRLFGGS